MHNGFQVLQLAAGETALHKAASYERHDSLAYGVDWWLHPAALQAKAPVLGLLLRPRLPRVARAAGGQQLKLHTESKT